MSRTPEERHPNRQVGECLISPTKKANGTKWKYWDNLLKIKEGELIFHLCGKDDKAEFVGFSTASSDGYITNKISDRNHNEHYIVELKDYTNFDMPINVHALFNLQEKMLREYYEHNKNAKQKKTIFYVIQSDKLQCQNGAYVSELSIKLASIIFGADFTNRSTDKKLNIINVQTGTQLRSISIRRGQDKLSSNVKNNYNYKCCFPDCIVDHPNILVGGHIARWADQPELRGDMTNGICFCLAHDKAFEAGIFTLSKDYKVSINYKKLSGSEWLEGILQPFDGQQIKIPPVSPSLKMHWERIKFTPE